MPGPPGGYYLGTDGKWVPGKKEKEEEKKYSGSAYDLVSSAHFAQIDDSVSHFKKDCDNKKEHNERSEQFVPNI